MFCCPTCLKNSPKKFIDPGTNSGQLGYTYNVIKFPSTWKEILMNKYATNAIYKIYF